DRLLHLPLALGYFASVFLLLVMLAFTLGSAPAFADESCDQDGVHVSYNLGYQQGPPAGYYVLSTTVSEISSNCIGAKLTVSFLQDNTVIGGGGPVDVAGTSMTVTSGTSPLAASVTRTTVLLDKATVTTSSSGGATNPGGGNPSNPPNPNPGPQPAPPS